MIKPLFYHALKHSVDSRLGRLDHGQTLSTSCGPDQLFSAWESVLKAAKSVINKGRGCEVALIVVENVGKRTVMLLPDSLDKPSIASLISAAHGAGEEGRPTDGVLSITMFSNIWTLPVKRAGPDQTAEALQGAALGAMHHFY